MNSIGFFSLSIIGYLMFAVLFQLTHGQGLAPSPAPNGPVSDGTAIDQGIAYALLLVALAITYLIH